MSPWGCDLTTSPTAAGWLLSAEHTGDLQSPDQRSSRSRVAPDAGNDALVDRPQLSRPVPGGRR